MSLSVEIICVGLSSVMDAVIKKHEIMDIVQKGGGVSGEAKLFIQFKYGHVIFFSFLSIVSVYWSIQ